MLRHMFIIPMMALSIAGAADTVRAMNARTRLQTRRPNQAFQTSISSPACKDVA